MNLLEQFIWFKRYGFDVTLSKDNDEYVLIEFKNVDHLITFEAMTEDDEDFYVPEWLQLRTHTDLLTKIIDRWS